MERTNLGGVRERRHMDPDEFERRPPQRGNRRRRRSRRRRLQPVNRLWIASTILAVIFLIVLALLIRVLFS